jgi:hypothetical protein
MKTNVLVHTTIATLAMTALAALAAVLPSAVVAGSSAPAFDPSNFSGHPIDNEWFPLTPGTTLVYKGQKDGKNGSDIFHVTNRTRMVAGVQATVVEDTLVLKGRVEEHTFDWYAQDDQGNVWYVGERTAEYDRQGNVVSTEGSWEAGVNGAEPGIFMPAHPHVGDTFRQEFLPGHAEDHFRIMNLDGSRTVPYDSFENVMRTREWTPIEPGTRDAKYYVKGIGEIEETAVRGPSEFFRLVQVIQP